MSRFAILPAPALAALLTVLVPSAARADHEEAFLALAAVGVLLPSEVGAEITLRPDRTAAPVIGWAYQVPRSLGHGPDEGRHRVTMELDWKPGSVGPDVAGRVGYRYARDRFAVGVGVAGDPDGLRLSPEILVQPWGGEWKPHLLVRAEGNASDLRGLAMLGWTMF